MDRNIKNEETCRLAGGTRPSNGREQDGRCYYCATRTPRTYIMRDNAVELHGLGD